METVLFLQRYDFGFANFVILLFVKSNCWRFFRQFFFERTRAGHAVLQRELILNSMIKNDVHSVLKLLARIDVLVLKL